MKTSKNRRGMALVVVLTVIVLAAVLVAAFLSAAMLERASSSHYASGLRAEEVARAGYNTVLADLRREIIAGSQIVTNAGGEVLFAMPRTNWTMLPQANAVLTNAPSLVRFSSTNVPAGFSNAAWFDTSALPPNRASAVSTATKSRNNRKVSASTWLAPQFAPTNNAATLAALTNNPPTWTYITRSGARALADSDAASAASESSANTNYVVGRYAFAVYDTGGMLDANLAGGATNLLSASVAASKGHQALADLTRLGLSTAQINALVQWRNAASAASSDDYTTYLRSTNGFTTGTSGDRAFFSRQDFLRYANANGWTNAAIANMAIFSRTPATPGFYPTYDASTFKAAAITVAATNSYRSSALTSTNNPALLAVRKADGSPVMEKKFNLDRLLWVTREGPIATLSPGNDLYDSALAALGGTAEAAAFLAQGNATNIQKYFGLVWDDRALDYESGTPAPDTDEFGAMWVYCSHNGTIGMNPRPSGIDSLETVAAQNREPNLFELLQATILKGSLGFATGDPSVVWVANANTTYGEWERRWQGLRLPPDPRGSTSGGICCNAREIRLDKDDRLFHAEAKYQIARMVANMIDQVDADSFPTVLRLNEENIWGIEDLPMFNGVGMFNARPLSNDPNIPNPNQHDLHQWVLFSLWNPHAMTPNPSGSAPSRFRIICRVGFTDPRPQQRLYYTSSTRSPDGPVNLSWASGVFEGEVFDDGTFFPPSWIEFSKADYADFREPRMVMPSGSSTISAPANRITCGSLDLVGIHTGSMEIPEHPDYVPKCAGAPLRTAAGPRPAQDLLKFGESGWRGSVFAAQSMGNNGLWWSNGNFMNLELQYQGPDLAWRTYDAIRGFIPSWAQHSSGVTLMPEDPDYPACLANVEASSGVNVEYSAPLQKARVSTGRVFVDPAYIRLDPRTTRFNIAQVLNLYSSDSLNRQFRIAGQIDRTLAPTTAANSGTLATQRGVGASAMVGPVGSSVFFQPDASGSMTASMFANNFQETTSFRGSYTDPDFVQRWGDGGQRSGNHPGTDNNASARPIILNRPFRNVGELGVVFRDTPWRTMDLLSEKSADAGLLEVFCVGESPYTNGAGRVNLNSAGRPVLEALLTGADLNQASNPTIVSVSASTNLVTDILARRSANGPIGNLSQLPAFFPQTNAVDAQYPAPKLQREGAVRALAGVGSTRTWNLLIDVIAQSGRLTPAAANLGSDFIVQGQKRYWMHVSLDRLTGEIVASQMEPYEE